jgi:drug/metabolite transporter (DMT)-like permease
VELKWALAIGFEAAFWLMLAAFLVLRYRFGIEAVTRYFVIGVVLDTLGILGLGLWDFVETGRVSGYTIFIAALLGYSFTYGKKDMRRLDRFIAERTGSRRRSAAAAGDPSS